MPWDAVLPLDVLRTTHSDYKPQLMKRHEALYEGGQKFESMKSQFLDRREIEYKYEDIFQNRLKQTRYVPHSSAVDVLIGDCFKDEPVIEAPEGIYEKWNKDVDGQGLDLSMLLRQALLEIFQHGRAAILVNFSQQIGTFLDQTTLDPTLHLLDASTIDDWSDGMVRLHYVENVRSNPARQPDMTRESWIYITDKEIATYQFEKKNDRPDPMQVSGTVASHDFGRTPVFPIKLSFPGMWVMNRLENPLVALFNRESSLAFSLNNTAFDIPVCNTTQTDINSMFISEVGMMKLAPGESFSRVGPNPAGYDALFRDVDRLRGDLHRTIAGMALEAQAKVQSPRQGAFAAAKAADPQAALLMAYSEPLIDVTELILSAVKKYRREEGIKTEVTGFEVLDPVAEMGNAVGQGGPSAQPSQGAKTPVQEEK